MPSIHEGTDRTVACLHHAQPAGKGTGVREQSVSLHYGEVSEGRIEKTRVEANKEKNNGMASG
jgi:hypothetical protein